MAKSSWEEYLNDCASGKLDEPGARGPKVISARNETEPCERGTVGCSIEHARSGSSWDCEAW